MPLYIHIAKFNFLRILAYPVDIVAYILRYIVKLLFLLAFWNIVASTTNNNIDPQYLMSYFLISIGLSDILMSDNTNLGRTIRKSVQRGNINQILIKPVNLIYYFYAQTVGSIGLRMILGVFSIIFGVLLNPPQNLISILLFVLFMIEAFFISFAYNLFEGSLSLIFTEVNGIKNAMHHVTRILSGQWIPYTFFSESIRNFLFFTPFPIMVFGPINSLSQTEISSEVFLQLLSGALWAILLNLLVLKFWRRNLKSYDAAGS